MSIYDTLNPQQQEAVYHTDGPLLILAGAGSGKTRVLTHRIAYLIDERNVNPWNILAITFTNKAAGEMRERVDHIVGNGAQSVWVSTFHSMCVRILRRYIDRIGYDTNFTIYDTDDQKTLMKEVCKYLQLDTKMFKEKAILGAISSAKNEMITPDDYLEQAEGDFYRRRIAQAYIEYDKRMRANNALDFDDLLVKTVQLFQMQPEILLQYQERFRYIMVDEYQDTNTVQFHLISYLANKYQNLCVVGDDDQSIYKFRGANIRNILNFEKEFPDTKVIKLEQNYRSTTNILNAANAVIRNNTERKDKRLWTENDEGEKIVFRQLESAFDEADYVVGDIRKAVRNGIRKYQDHAILYRTNAQSRMFEEKLVMAGVPYKIVGGINFYSRREIKDILAYLKTIDNGRDDIAVKRIINVPKRGIGAATLGKVQVYAEDHEFGFYESLQVIENVPSIGKAAAKIRDFVDLIEEIRGIIETDSISAGVGAILEKTGYLDELKAEDPEEAEARVQNVEELFGKIVSYEEACVEAGEKFSLSAFLEEVALVADIDSLESDMDYVVLMTLHSAKGLEFPHVYLVGMEDGLFPGYNAVNADDNSELEEERRLCYVGITRAREELTLTCCKRRMIRGETQFNPMSRFLREVPKELLDDGNIFRNSPEPKRRDDTYSSKAAFKKPAYYMEKQPAKQFTVSKGDGPGYGVGDRVSHTKFGEGTVTNIVAGGRDYEVTVDFDQFGTKKMFAMFAKMQKID